MSRLMLLMESGRLSSFSWDFIQLSWIRCPLIGSQRFRWSRTRQRSLRGTFSTRQGGQRRLLILLRRTSVDQASGRGTLGSWEGREPREQLQQGPHIWVGQFSLILLLLHHHYYQHLLREMGVATTVGSLA